MKLAFLFPLSVCAVLAGCGLDDPCEGSKMLDANGKCVPVPHNADSCGRDVIDCKTWAASLYTDKSLADISHYKCNDDACIIDNCDTGYKLMTLAEVRDDCDKFGLNCDEAHYGITDDSFKICVTMHCYENGDRKDDDYDGIINCMDACPNNKTKSEKSVWGENGELQGGCAVEDTDRDGVDDSLDECPTRSDRSGVLADGAVADDVSCGIFDREKLEFHVYHAADLLNLKQKLEQYYSDKLKCPSASERRCYKDMNANADYYLCLKDVYMAYECTDGCKTGDSITCKDKRQFARTFKIFLEDNINLNDIADKDDTSPFIPEAGVLECKRVINLNELKQVELNGKYHTISYSRRMYDEASENLADVRCYLTGPLFSRIIASKIINLNLDLDVKSSGAHAILADNADSSEFRDIRIIAGTLETEAIENVGGLVGNVQAEYLEKKKAEDTTSLTRFNKIILENLNIRAPKAAQVAALAGNADVNWIELNEIQLRKTNVAGALNVGGLIGKLVTANKADIEDIENQLSVVTGNQYVGGLFGNLNYDTNSKQQDTILTIRKIKNQMEAVEGKENTGGIFGFLQSDRKLTIDGVQNAVKSISGESSVGGIAGKIQYSKVFTFQNVNNQVEAISASINAGGVVGSFLMNAAATYKSFYNRVDSLNGNDNIGGFVGSVDCTGTVQLKYNTIYNEIHQILSASGSNIGGFAGLANSDIDGAKCSTALTDIYQHTDEIQVAESHNVGGFVGLIQKQTGFSINHAHLENDAVSGTELVGGQFGSILSPVSLTSVSAYADVMSGVNQTSGGFYSALTLTGDQRLAFDTAFVAAGVQQACEHILAPEHPKKFISVKNTYWFPLVDCVDAEHILPFEEGAAAVTNLVLYHLEDKDTLLFKQLKNWKAIPYSYKGESLELPVAYDKETIFGTLSEAAVIKE